jgi:hypothetical protein
MPFFKPGRPSRNIPTPQIWIQRQKSCPAPPFPKRKKKRRETKRAKKKNARKEKKYVYQKLCMGLYCQEKGSFISLRPFTYFRQYLKKSD